MGEREIMELPIFPIGLSEVVSNKVLFEVHSSRFYPLALLKRLCFRLLPLLLGQFFDKTSL